MAEPKIDREDVHDMKKECYEKDYKTIIYISYSQEAAYTSIHVPNVYFPYHVVVVCLPRPMEGSGDSNFQIFPQNCQFHHRQLEPLEHFNVLFIYHSEHYSLIFRGYHIIIIRSPLFSFCVHFHTKEHTGKQVKRNNQNQVHRLVWKRGGGYCKQGADPVWGLVNY